MVCLLCISIFLVKIISRDPYYDELGRVICHFQLVVMQRFQKRPFYSQYAISRHKDITRQNVRARIVFIYLLTLLLIFIFSTFIEIRCNVTPNTFMSFLEHQVIRLHDVSYCKSATFTCSSLEKYRSIDGTCNNLEHPAWGRRNAPFTRIAKPRYADGAL